MKKTVLSIALLVIVCLALTGCGQSDNNAETATDNESSLSAPDESQESAVVEDIQNDFNPDTNENPKKDADGWYMYKVDGRDINLKTNVWDYIETVDGKRVFNALKLAEDLGWEWSDVDRTDYDTSARGPEWKRRFRLESYSGDFDSRQMYVEFFGADRDVYEVCTNFDVIDFDRLDLKNDGISNTFFLNGIGDHGQTVNIEEIIISCYLFERTTEDTNDNLLIKGGIYGYTPIVVHK